MHLGSTICLSFPGQLGSDGRCFATGRGRQDDRVVYLTQLPIVIGRSMMPIPPATASSHQLGDSRGASMQTRLCAVLVLAAAMLCSTARAQSDQNVDWCNDASDPDRTIQGCTALIQSGQETRENLVLAFMD